MLGRMDSRYCEFDFGHEKGRMRYMGYMGYMGYKGYMGCKR